MIAKTASLVALASALALAAQGAGAGELLQNGDFEQALKGWGKEGSKEPASIERDAPFAGKYSCKLFREGDAEARIYSALSKDFDPKRPCKISLSIRCEGAKEGELRVRLLCMGEDGKPLRWAWLPANSGLHDLLVGGGTHPWKKLECVLSPDCYPQGTAKATLFIDRKSNGEGTVWLDEISVENVDAVERAQDKAAAAQAAPEPAKEPKALAKNLLPGDVSFETGIEGWNAKRDVSKAWHGEASLLLDEGSGGAGSAVYLKLLKAKQPYVLSFKATAGKPCALGCVLQDMQNWNYAAHGEAKLDDTWRDVSIKIPPQPATASVKLSFSKPKDAKVWIDALSLTAGDLPSEFAPNAPFAVGVDGAEAPGRIYLDGKEAPALFLRARNDSGADAEASLAIVTESMDGTRQERLSKRAFLKSGETFSVPFKALDEAKRGFYAVRATFSPDSSKTTFKSSYSFAVVDQPLPPSKSSFFGIHPGGSVPSEALSRIGVKWSRDILSWKYIKSKPGSFEAPDKWFERSFYMMLSQKITSAPDWAIEPKGGFKDAGAYVEFMKACVEKAAGRCACWEFENEPDLTYPKFLGLETEKAAAAYAKTVKAAAKAVRELQPDAKIMAAGVSGGDFNTGFPFLKKCLQDAGDSIDVLPVHPYANARYIGPEASDIGPDLNKTLEKTRALRKIVDEAGGKQRVWFGEIGWALDIEEDFLSPAAARHAEYLYKLMVLGKAAGVEKVMYFLTDSCVEKERYYYGIWRNGAPLPAAAAYAASAQTLEGASFKEDLMNAELKAYAFVSRDGRPFAAIWMERGAPVKASLAAKASELEARDLFNNPVALGEEGGRASFKIGSAPLIVYAKSLKPDALAELVKGGSYECPPVKCSWRLLDASRVALGLKSLRATPLEGSVAFKAEGLPASSKELAFKLKPEQEESFEFELKGGSLDGRKLSAEIASGAGALKTEYSAALHACPYLKDGMKTGKAEFEKLASIKLDSRESLLPNDPEIGWTGPENLSVKALVGWNERALYLFAEVRDDVHCQKNARGQLWAGDSIQIAIDAFAEASKDRFDYGRNDYELTLGLTKDGADAECDYIYEKGRAASFNDGVEREIVRSGDKTFYKAGIPWSSLKREAKPGLVFGFNFIANDDDGRGRRYWLGITPGIGEMKYTWPYWKFRLDPPK